MHKLNKKISKQSITSRQFDHQQDINIILVCQHGQSTSSLKLRHINTVCLDDPVHGHTISTGLVIASYMFPGVGVTSKERTGKHPSPCIEYQLPSIITYWRLLHSTLCTKLLIMVCGQLLLRVSSLQLQTLCFATEDTPSCSSSATGD